MTSFPEEYELLSFFEVDPKVLDEGIPWMYNSLTFEKLLENETLVCVFSPAYGEVDLKLIQNGVDKLVLNLSAIDKIEILKEKKQEHLKIKFKEDVPFKNFLLAIKPEVRIIWGTAWR